MMDIARERGCEVSIGKLADALGCRVIPMVARSGQGIEDLLAAIEDMPCGCCNGGMPRFIDCLPQALEKPVQTLTEGLVQSKLADVESARGEALWLLVSSLEGDDAARTPPAMTALARRVRSEFKLSSKQVRAIETSARYRYLKDLMFLAACTEQDLPHRLTDRLDRVLLHRLCGPVIFLALMALVFQSIFSWAAPVMNVIEAGVGLAAQGVDYLLPDGFFKEMVMQGAVAGVGNVLVFLPQILVLFLFIGLLEDVGYMARAAFLMDRLMARVGLDGRAFLPLLSSFACAIPGIMATRTIAGKKDRLVTILVAPLMSCSARLPVYTLVIGTVFAAETKVAGLFTVGGLVLMGMYVLSITVGITMAAIFKRTLLKSPPPPLLLELPTYKLPSLKSVALNLYDRGRLFTIRAGTIILAATVILWGVLHVPLARMDHSRFEEARRQVTADSSRGAALRAISGEENAAVVENSLGGHLGKLIEPVIAPLGFDWKIGVGIIASFAAREVFVSGLAVVHGVDGADETSPSLRETLRREKRAGSGEPLFTPLVGVALLVFFVLACQCMSTVAIVRRETGGWRWPLFMIGYMTVLAWLGAFVVYQGGKLAGLG
jgi:ferrous iron transport protein B